MFLDPKTKFLIVDDALSMRATIKRMLMGMGFSDFLEAEDGNTAWKVLRENEGVGFILSDWNMAGGNGIDFLKKVRADEKYKDLPFMMITANSEQEDIVTMLQAGVNNYIIKPFTPEDLSGKLERIAQKLA